MTVVKRVLGATTVALLVVALAAGCGSDAPKPKPTISDASTTPAGYDPTVVPERPADVNTADGSVTFAEYVILVYYYTKATFDPELLTSIANMDTCEACNNYQEAAAHPTDYELRVTTSEPQFTVSNGPNYFAYNGSYGMIIDVAPLTYEVYSTGDRTELDPLETTREEVQINVMWKDGQWQLQQIQLDTWTESP